MSRSGAARLRSGTAIVLVFVAAAGTALLCFRLYGDRVMAARPPDSPPVAAEAFARADNTLVGRLGAIHAVVPLDVRAVNAQGHAAAALRASVVGARDSGALYADLAVESGRWTVREAAFLFPDGERLPLAGARRPLLEPPAGR